MGYPHYVIERIFGTGTLWCAKPTRIQMTHTDKKIQDKLEVVEREHVLRTLERHGWNITKASEVLGIARKTLYRKLERWGVWRP